MWPLLRAPIHPSIYLSIYVQLNTEHQDPPPSLLFLASTPAFRFYTEEMPPACPRSSSTLAGEWAGMGQLHLQGLAPGLGQGAEAEPANTCRSWDCPLGDPRAPPSHWAEQEGRGILSQMPQAELSTTLPGRRDAGLASVTGICCSQCSQGQAEPHSWLSCTQGKRVLLPLPVAAGQTFSLQTFGPYFLQAQAEARTAPLPSMRRAPAEVMPKRNSKHRLGVYHGQELLQHLPCIHARLTE